MPATAYLLAWNPKRAPWKARSGILRRVRCEGYAEFPWSVAAKSVEPGDRMFFIRLGLPPRGIFASGVAVSRPYSAPHWDPSKWESGQRIRLVDLRIDRMLDPDTEEILPRSALDAPAFNVMHWNTQSSGIHVPAPVAWALEDAWYGHLNRLGNNAGESGLPL